MERNSSNVKRSIFPSDFAPRPYGISLRSFRSSPRTGKTKNINYCYYYWNRIRCRPRVASRISIERYLWCPRNDRALQLGLQSSDIRERRQGSTFDLLQSDFSFSSRSSRKPFPVRCTVIDLFALETDRIPPPWPQNRINTRSRRDRIDLFFAFAFSRILVRPLRHGAERKNK